MCVFYPQLQFIGFFDFFYIMLPNTEPSLKLFCTWRRVQLSIYTESRLSCIYKFFSSFLTSCFSFFLIFNIIIFLQNDWRAVTTPIHSNWVIVIIILIRLNLIFFYLLLFVKTAKRCDDCSRIEIYITLSLFYDFSFLHNFLNKLFFDKYIYSWNYIKEKRAFIFFMYKRYYIYTF